MLKHKKILCNEQGLALLMTVFVLSLATILTMGLAKETNTNLKSSRGFIEAIQAEFLLKSALNQGIIALADKDRNEPGIIENQTNDDNHTESWTVFNSGNELSPVSNIIGTYKVFITDESNKININTLNSNTFWRDKLTLLMETQLGFVQETFPEEERRTLGNQAFNSANQVASIIDYIDTDSQSYTINGFKGAGIESRQREWFPIKSSGQIDTISELSNVPGMTVERLRRLAPYVKSSSNNNSNLNIITALKSTPEILIALGADPEAINAELSNISSGQYSPLDIRDNLFSGRFDQGLINSNTAFQSNFFSIIAEVQMPNISRWLRAEINLSSGSNIEISKVEFY